MLLFGCIMYVTRKMLKEFLLQVNALASISGDSLGYITRAILRRVVSNSVAVSYSWCGGKGKLRFDELSFKPVLFRKCSEI